MSGLPNEKIVFPSVRMHGGKSMLQSREVGSVEHLVEVPLSMTQLAQTQLRLMGVVRARGRQKVAAFLRWMQVH